MALSQPPPLPAFPQAEEKSGRAVASLVMGICSIVLCLGPMVGIPAVIFGHLAQSDIKKSRGRLGGSGLATTGLVLGYFSFLWVFVIGLLAAIAVPNFVRAKHAAEAAACRINMTSIQAAKEEWAKQQSKPGDALPTDDDLFGPSKYINQKPGCPGGGSYTLNSVQESPDCSVHGAIANDK